MKIGKAISSINIIPIMDYPPEEKYYSILSNRYDSKMIKRGE